MFSHNGSSHTQKIYINGAVDETGSLGAPVEESASFGFIGGRADVDNTVDGYLSELWLHKKVFSDTEVDLMYQSMTSTGLVTLQ